MTKLNLEAESNFYKEEQEFFLSEVYSLMEGLSVVELIEGIELKIKRVKPELREKLRVELKDKLVILSNSL